MASSIGRCRPPYPAWFLACLLSPGLGVCRGLGQPNPNSRPVAFEDCVWCRCPFDMNQKGFLGLPVKPTRLIHGLQTSFAQHRGVRIQTSTRTSERETLSTNASRGRGREAT